MITEREKNFWLNKSEHEEKMIVLTLLFTLPGVGVNGVGTDSDPEPEPLLRAVIQSRIPKYPDAKAIGELLAFAVRCFHE